MRAEWHEIIAAEIESVPYAELARAAQQLTAAYREDRTGSVSLINSAAQRAAYLAVRMPATYAAIASVFQRLRECAPDLEVHSLLDLGAGPGTASLAAVEHFPSLSNISMVERDAHFSLIAGRLLPSAIITMADIASVRFPIFDLVVCAYALNELAHNQRTDVIAQVCSSAVKAVVFVEPGSPAGFANILAAREHLIATGWNVAAPCPGHMPCSLAQVNDWCHFSSRVQRTALHRRLKEATLAYEDEKFSYVAAVRDLASPAQSRIVRRPEKLTGHVKLALCTCDGLQLATITKKSGPAYKTARKAEWGDAFTFGEDGSRP